jgi:hypothetical protein
MSGDNFNLQGSTDVQINKETQGAVSKTSTNIQATNIDHIDLGALTEQLETLQNRVAQMPDSPEKEQASTALAEAKTAAAEDNRSKILSALKSGGTWLLGVAKEIGVPLAISAIKVAIGLAV